MSSATKRFLADLAGRLGGSSEALSRPGLTVVADPQRSAAAEDGPMRPLWIAWHEGAALVSCLPPIAPRIRRALGTGTDHKQLFSKDHFDAIEREIGKYLTVTRIVRGYSWIYPEPDLDYQETEPVVRLSETHRDALELLDETAWDRLRDAICRGDVFGVLRDEYIVAMAYVEHRGEKAWAVRVQTDPDQRHKGHGRQAAGRLTRYCLGEGMVPYFTAGAADDGALRIGQDLHYVKLTEEAWVEARPKA